MTYRLLAIAVEKWEDIDGYGVGHGFDPAELSLTRMANFTWWWVTQNAEKNEVEKFKNRLWRPPPGEVVTNDRSPWHADNENQALSSLKAALGGSSKSQG